MSPHGEKRMKRQEREASCTPHTERKRKNMSSLDEKENQSLQELDDRDLDMVTGGGLGAIVHNAFAGVKAGYQDLRESGFGRFTSAGNAVLVGPYFGIKYGGTHKKASAQEIRQAANE
jgi:hypothetical protein